MLNYLSITIAINYLLIYLHLNILFFLIIFTLKHDSFRYVIDLKKYNKIPLIFTFLIFIFFSFAGLPPFIGFFSKFFVFWLTLVNEHYFSFFLCSWITFFSGYFYIQNIRYFIQKNKKTFYFISNNKIYNNTYHFYLIIFLSIINIFGFIFLMIIIFFPIIWVVYFFK